MEIRTLFSSLLRIARVNKIKVVLKINEINDTPSCLTINKIKNSVSLIDPTPSRRNHSSNSGTNHFPFDSIFTENDEQSEILSSAIVGPVEDLFSGKDACIFSLGSAGIGKSNTMIGSDRSLMVIGIIPCTIAWIFKIIDLINTDTETIHEIRISALEISRKNVVRDLLGSDSTDSSNSKPMSPDKSDSIVWPQKESLVCDVHEAISLMDNVLGSCSCKLDDTLRFTIHLYRYRSGYDETNDSLNLPVLLDVSRLHLLDLGSRRQGIEDSSALSLQGMFKVILALYTSQRHVPYKDNVLTNLLKETLSVNTFATMVVQTSSKEQHYNDTLQIIQLASKLYRTRSRRSRSMGLSLSDETSSCSSSSSGFHCRRPRPHMGIGAALRSNGSSGASSELDKSSASELSCCETVIFRENCLQQPQKSSSTESDGKHQDVNEMHQVVSRRKLSPRTNAKAWPLSNVAIDSCEELWVDGPNAVYKIDQEKNEVASKETQCDVASSLTDVRSPDNTVDRKEYRPLSDISECTEEAESTEIVKMALMEDIYMENDLDDLLESTFGPNLFHQDNTHQSTFHQIVPVHQHDTDDEISKYDDRISIITETDKMINLDDSVGNIRIPRKHYPSASESKVSSKSDLREGKRKSRCKRCSKKSCCKQSTMSSSNIDFSRVASWIQQVETSKITDINAHTSQPDITIWGERIGAKRVQSLPDRRLWTGGSEWMNCEVYGGYEDIPVSPCQIRYVQPPMFCGLHPPGVMEGNFRQSVISYTDQIDSKTPRMPHCASLERYQNDFFPQNEENIGDIQETKSRKKFKKEKDNLISIIFAPFTLCKNGKKNSDKKKNTDKSPPRVFESSSINITASPEYCLPSPYHLATPLKRVTVPTETSGHASLHNRLTRTEQTSDSFKPEEYRNKSSNINCRTSAHRRPSSSGYGSTIVKGDSEISSHNDSSSEYSISAPYHWKVNSSHLKHVVPMSQNNATMDNTVSDDRSSHWTEKGIDCRFIKRYDGGTKKNTT